MHANVAQEHRDGVRDEGSALLNRGLENFLAAGDELPHQLVCFAALGFESIAWCLPGHLTAALTPLPPFDEIVAGALLPNVLAAYAGHRYKTPEVRGLANFLDDSNSF